MSDPRPYLTPAWKALRARILRRRPICEACRMAKATCVDHTIRHRGDPELFWDEENLVALCWSCHSSKTVKRDGGWGRKPSDIPLRGTAGDGMPISKTHHWNK